MNYKIIETLPREVYPPRHPRAGKFKNKVFMVECNCGDIRRVSQSNLTGHRICPACKSLADNGSDLPKVQPNEFIRAMDSATFMARLETIDLAAEAQDQQKINAKDLAAHNRVSVELTRAEYRDRRDKLNGLAAEIRRNA